jgi:Holliday junction resolvase RusA-like endonuclease
MTDITPSACYPYDNITSFAPCQPHNEFVQFWVGGEPVPQGSTKSFYIKKLNRVVTTHGNKETMSWRGRIAHEAQVANGVREQPFYHDDPRESYTVTAAFVFSVPKSYPKKNRDGTPKRVAMTKRPDLDKLVRALLDGITGVLIPDDAQVTNIIIGKEYVSDRCPAPGLSVTVTRGVLRGH